MQGQNLALKNARSLVEKSCQLVFSPVLMGVRALLHSPSAPAAPQQISSFVAKESITPTTDVRL